MLHMMVRRIRKNGNDDGAVAIVAAIIIAFIALGMLSLTLDVGTLYEERRQLQNGADSAATALAKVYSLNSTPAPSPVGYATGYANANSRDNLSTVTGIYGNSGNTHGLPVYGGAYGSIYNCTSPPSGVEYVEVHTQTQTSGGSLMNFNSGGTVSACARAAILRGGIGTCPVGGQCLGITISECEWIAAKNKAGGIVSTLPPYAVGHYPTLRGYETQLNINGALPAGSSCPGLAPGGFGPMEITGGWLAPPVALSNCPSTTAFSCYEGDNGNGNGTWDGVGAVLYPPDGATKASGTRFYIPVYTTVHSSGSHQYYGILGFAAFVPTCVNLKHQNTGRNVNWIAGIACPTEGTISGFFTSDALTTGAGGGQNFGVTVPDPKMIR